MGCVANPVIMLEKCCGKSSLYCDSAINDPVIRTTRYNPASNAMRYGIRCFKKFNPLFSIMFNLPKPDEFYLGLYLNIVCRH